MTRTITIVQRKGHCNIFTPKRQKAPAPDCAHCRHSKVEIIDGAFKFICKLAHAVMDAKTCGDFRDARIALDGNYLRIT